jgi:hypothetical protein
MFQNWLSKREWQATVDWIADHQRSDGAIPWFPGGKLDPWDHVECVMALTVAQRFEAARAGFRFLANTQGADGAWAAATSEHEVVDPTRETNHAAYLASGLWHYYRGSRDVDFLAEMFPTLDRAMGFVLHLQDESGAIWWGSDGKGNVWPAPLLTGCSSIHGSLLCAVRIAERLDRDKPEWSSAHERLGSVLRNGKEVFTNAQVAAPVGHYSMDWYYPILGGAIRGEAAHLRLEQGRQTFLDAAEAGIGCRCVIDRPWYTAAETCELIMALDACGLVEEAQWLFEWVHTLREEDGGYWTGITHPDRILWPDERPTWTAASVILAADTLTGESPTSRFFRDLGTNGNGA